jgi:hypothetical protein
VLAHRILAPDDLLMHERAELSQTASTVACGQYQPGVGRDGVLDGALNEAA